MSNAKIANVNVPTWSRSIQKLHLLLFMITIWEVPRDAPHISNPRDLLDRLQIMEVKSRHMKVLTRKTELWPH